MRQEDYPPGTIVFAKLKGYPWWPARVEDDKNVPPHVLSARSTKSKNPVWTVFFFGSKDYGFFGPDAIKPFHPDNVERDLNDKKFKTKDLENAIRQALYPSLLEDEENEEEEEEEHEQEEKKSQRTKTKSKTKKAVKGGKRASKMEEDEKEKIFTATERGARKKKSTLTSSDASSRRKRVIMKRGQKERNRIYKLRHKLQRLVYNKKPGEIPKEDYRTISAVLKSVEDAHMTAQLLRDTKVGSVVKSASRYVYEDDEEVSVSICSFNDV
ncbi:hypothetical protein BX666DRAFT_2020791 [Dichotomocladium elegans]|nr:hypothetical protein BX666DRAFT_2020791 [Dichotomocladium elegans]